MGQKERKGEKKKDPRAQIMGEFTETITHCNREGNYLKVLRQGSDN